MISTSYDVQIHYDRDDGFACIMFVECMERCRVTWINRTYVCIGDRLNVKIEFVFDVV